MSRPSAPNLASAWERGMTLIEVLAAAVIGTVLVGGVMAAFLTAMRLGQQGGGTSEAATYAQETLERYRNHIACDDAAWFNPATCAFVGPIAGSPVPALPGGALFGGATRTYSVAAADCDGVGGAGDCFKVMTKVAWTPP